MQIVQSSSVDSCRTGYGNPSRLLGSYLMVAGKEGLARKYLEGVTSIERRIRLFLLTIRKHYCAFSFRNKDGKTNEADSKFLEIERN